MVGWSNPRIPLSIALTCSLGLGLVSPDSAQADSRRKKSAPKVEEKQENQKAPIVGILHVATDGVSDAAAAKFESSLGEGLKLHGLKVATRAEMRKKLGNSKYLDGCLFGPCLKEIYRASKGRVGLVLVARISGEGSSYRFLVSLLDTQTGAPTSQMPTGCTVCTVDEAIAASTLAVVELVAGTNDVSVLHPGGPMGPTAAVDLRPLRWPQERKAKYIGYSFLSAGVAAAIISGVMLSKDMDSAGYGLLGAAAGLGLGGASLVYVSGVF